MRVYSSHKELLRSLGKNQSVGLVPTMGSLHKGHLSLIQRAVSENKEVIVSIYVNPTQFDDKEDLKKYPRNLDNDLKILEDFNNILVYTPSDSDLYNEYKKSKKYNFGDFMNIMEGKYRPDHFDGVATVVEKLFKIFTPNNAYFGEKDFQQLILIKSLAEKLDLNLSVVGCKTIREEDGLAMSSRNKLLSKKERESAGEIIKLLLKAKEMNRDSNSGQIKKMIISHVDSIDDVDLEYFEIINLSKFLDTKETRAFIACKVGDVRLIDNISF
ncbi:pantoate--beta-alanine ligase [Flavobacteriaceae bacterium]|nr:pantoate--beta-alanine ligase [Flavobacteriaceae bacterium]